MSKLLASNNYIAFISLLRQNSLTYIHRLTTLSSSPLPRCRQCLWCHSCSRTAVGCSCWQQRCSFQEPGPPQPFLPILKSALQNTRRHINNIFKASSCIQMSFLGGTFKNDSLCWRDSAGKAKPLWPCQWRKHRYIYEQEKANWYIKREQVRREPSSSIHLISAVRSEGTLQTTETSDERGQRGTEKNRGDRQWIKWVTNTVTSDFLVCSTSNIYIKHTSINAVSEVVGQRAV